MRGGLTGVAVAMIALGLAQAGTAAASPRDVASTHAYLAADYAVLHASVGSWPRVEAAIDRLDARLGAECPRVGEGSPQSEEEQKFSLEVAGALWATAYGANAGAVHRFVKAVDRLSWSNPTITRAARRLTKALSAMTSLGVPPLCSDVRAWAASGFGAVPADVGAYARHVEAIEINQVPLHLLAPFAHGSDASLTARVAGLNRRFEELEFVHGQDNWNKLLEVLALNQ